MDRRNRRECSCCSIQVRRCNSFTDKFRRAKHRSQCSILLIGVFAGGIRFNSRMRWVDISLEVSWAARNGWRLFPYPYSERRGRAKNLPGTRNPLLLILIFVRCLLLIPRIILALSQARHSQSGQQSSLRIFPCDISWYIFTFNRETIRFEVSSVIFINIVY